MKICTIVKIDDPGETGRRSLGMGGEFWQNRGGPSQTADQNLVPSQSEIVCILPFGLYP